MMVLHLQLPYSNPDLNENGQKLIEIDVVLGWIDVFLPVLWIFYVALGKPALKQVRHGQPPHVVELCGPASKAIEGCICVHCDCRISWDEQAYRWMPHVVVQIIIQFPLQVPHFSQNVLWKKNPT